MFTFDCCRIRKWRSGDFRLQRCHHFIQTNPTGTITFYSFPVLYRQNLTTSLSNESVTDDRLFSWILLYFRPSLFLFPKILALIVLSGAICCEQSHHCFAVFQGDKLRVEILSLTFEPSSRVALDKSVQRVYVEYRLLGVPMETTETPMSLRKPTKGEEIHYNFTRGEQGWLLWVFDSQLSYTWLRCQQMSVSDLCGWLTVR